MNKVAIAAFLLLFSGCSNEIRVYSDFDPGYHVLDYTTFNWSQKTNIEAQQNPLYYNELNDKRIKEAALAELTNRGYTLTDKSPELILHYHIIVEDQSVVTTEPYGYYYGPYWLNTRTNYFPYKEGTLILDLMEAKTNALVWRGWAVAPVDTGYNSDHIDKLIKTAIVKIFKTFPKKTKQSKHPEGITLK